jgi:hypothetical protein
MEEEIIDSQSAQDESVFKADTDVDMDIWV